VLFISPFLRAMVMKKNHSEEFKQLWNESRMNHAALIATIVVRFIIAMMFVFYICNYLTRFTNAVMIVIAVVVVMLMVLSRRLKRRSIRMERMFLLNLRSRDIKAQVYGHKRPLYAGHLLDRDIHISDFDVPEDSLWAGKTLEELQLRSKFGVNVSSILRGRQRINIPSGDDRIYPCDKIQVIGSDEQLTALSKALKNNLHPEDPNIEKREMKLRQLVISEDGQFFGKTLSECGIRDIYDCMVVGMEEGEENLSMLAPNQRFYKDDTIWVVGEKENLERLMEANRTRK
jgi:CPA2 family monovalent cation:H+ antiporter-2